jgi:hypothetical protein
MVAAVGVRTSQARVFAIGAYPTADLRVGQSHVEAVAKPSTDVRVGQSHVEAVAKPAPDLRVGQARVLVVARGRVSDPHVRAWTFTLDGHDYYVLRLGNDETLLYDLSTEQWYIWGSGDADLWRAFVGMNWQGAKALSPTYGSAVLVGDDGNGALYFLDPTGYYDDDAIFGNATPRQFLREITGQVATRSRDSVPCYGVHLIGSVGETTEAALTAITLYTSDDQGHTYDQHDTIDVANAEYNARVEWGSLGAFSAPGRLFRVQDYGALYRIDFLEMIEPPEKR